MVSITLSMLINNIRHVLHNSLPIRRSKANKNHNAHENTLAVLYPRLLMKRRDSKNSMVFDTLAAAQFFSNSTFTFPSTASRQSNIYNGLDIPVTPQYRPPRAPIVLCHGLYGFDRRGPESLPMFQIRYWGGVEEALAKLGAKVIVTKVPRTGSVWERAQALHDILKGILSGGQVNFVAHSMGGLDCRCLLSHIRNRPYHVQSLTTISTPHQGSPVMDWFRDHVGVGVTYAIMDAAANATSQCHRQQKQKSMANFFDPVIQVLDTPAYANLTTDYCKNHFNPNTPDDPSVAYYSYGANTAIPPWTFLGMTWQVVNEREGDNDGIVSVESAKWGKYIKTLDAHHWNLNGQRYRWRSTSRENTSNSNFDPTAFYMELATHLYEQGH